MKDSRETPTRDESMRSDGVVAERATADGATADGAAADSAAADGMVRWHPAIIVLYTLAVHGLLLLNDGLYRDDWQLYTFLKYRTWDGLYQWFAEVGFPFLAHPHWLLGHFPGIVFAYKLLAFIAVTTAGLLIYAIGVESKLVSRLESLLIALLSLSYPAFQVWFSMIVLPYLACYSIFLGGVLLALRAERAGGAHRAILIVAALTCFFVSFTTNSLLVFYGGFLWLLFIYAQLAKAPQRQLFLEVACFVAQRAHYMLLPLIYWASKQALFPVYGFHTEYNQLVWAPKYFLIQFKEFFANAVFGTINLSLEALAQQPVLWLVILLGCQWSYSHWRVGAIRCVGRRSSPYALLAFGCGLLLLGMLPYVAVRKAPVLVGFYGRFALLIALPMAIILVALARLALASQTDSLSNLGWTFLMGLLAVFSLSTLEHYCAAQARWIKYRSVIVNLPSVSGAKDFSVFWVDDRYLVRRNRRYALPYESEGYSAWTALFKLTWGNETHFGLDKRTIAQYVERKKPYFFPRRDHLRQFDPKGRQAILTIQEGSHHMSNIDLVAGYTWHRFVRRQRLTPFLRQVTHLEVQPVSATHDKASKVELSGLTFTSTGDAFVLHRTSPPSAR